jgi:nicotinate dehydrogenase subunit B
MIRTALPESLSEYPRLDQWVAFESHGVVRLATGKVEIGQGIVTALVQIAAEELGVEPGRFRVVSGETGRVPDEGYTAGSRSVEMSGGSIRVVCAEVRALFLRHLAARLGCLSSELSIQDGRFLQQGRETGLDYWALVQDVDLSQTISGEAPTRRPSEFRVIGRSLPRFDLPAKIFGAAFIHDMALEGMRHGRVLRRPWRNARLATLDESAVRRAAREPIEILREGELLALVADDEVTIGLAAEKARAVAQWEGGEPLETKNGEAKWLETQKSIDRVVIDRATGSTRAQERVVRARYSRPFIAHASIGPSCALAHYENGHLTVWTHSQGVYHLRQALVRSLGLDEERVSVLHRQGAGCYGHNGADDAAFDAAFIALRRPGRPVRVQWSREDELSSSPFGAAHLVELEATLSSGGRPSSWKMELWSPPHGQRPGMNGGINLLGAATLPDAPPEPEPRDVPDERGGGGTRNAIALYDLPQRVIHHFIPKAPVRTSSLRSLGAFTNVFAIESFMDELAEAAGADPIRYRLSLLTEPRARRVIETAAEMAAWSESPERVTSRGKGLGFARYKNGSAYCALVAEVSVEEEVHLHHVWCAVDAGLIINPDGATNQIEGGILQAASWTLKEQVRFEDGRIATDRWESYPILRFSEVPEIDVQLVASSEEIPLGVGEATMGPTAAAIANAVHRALGTRIRDLPLTRERILAAMLADPEIRSRP